MTRHPIPLIALHWLTAVVVITAYVTSGDPSEAKNSLDFLIGQTHVLSGITVFALVALRLPLRALLGAPPAEPVSRWQQRATGHAPWTVCVDAAGAACRVGGAGR